MRAVIKAGSRIQDLYNSCTNIAASVKYVIDCHDNHTKWFGGGAHFEVHDKSHHFRVGGQAVEDGQWHDGPTSRFESTYTDIVDLQRIVFTYDMWVDGRHLSTSLTTIALERDGDQTRLTYTEQGVHFDGLDSVEGREEGTKGLLDQLGACLTRGH